MTADLDGRPLAPPLPVPARPSANRLRLFRLPAAWPIVLLLGGFPIWWALGFGVFIFMIMAVPMAVHLWRRRPIKLPTGFGLWALFLVWLIAGIFVLELSPIGTIADSLSSRLFGYGLRLGSYLALTIMLIYIGNLTEEELPRRRLVGLLAWMFVVTTAGGMLGVLAPHLSFTSPFELILPGSIRTNSYVQSLVHPASSQLQDVLGYQAPRPKAPYEYTNAWGNNLSITGVWFVAYLALGGLTRFKGFRWPVAALVFVLALIGAIWSLNRGLWIGLGLSIVYVAVRLAMRRKFAVLGALGALICLLAVAVPFSPLGDVISARLDNGKSNAIRTNLTQQTIEVVKQSPLLGFGSTRTAIGSPDSLTVGKSADCPQCGNFVIGSNGQIWQLLVATGYVGLFLYLAFFLYSIWRYRSDDSAIGIAGGLVLCLALFYALVYNAVPSPLAFYFLSVGLLWRNRIARREKSAREGVDLHAVQV